MSTTRLSLAFVSILACSFGAGHGYAAEPAQDAPFDPFAASVLHLGGGAHFSWSQTSVGGAKADPVTTFQLEGEVGYFPVAGLKLSGIPLMTVVGQDGVTTVMAGAGVGVSYYQPVGGIALFVRARGGLLMGTTNAETTERVNGTQGTATSPQTAQIAIPETSQDSQNLTGFFYGGGLGAALPVGTNVIELSVEYQGASLAVDSPLGEQEGEEQGVFVGLGYLMAF